MVQFPQCGFRCLCIQQSDTGISSSGLPHSAIPGSQGICPFPELFAAYHGLLRLATPRHPPMDPYSLDHIIVLGFPGFARESPQFHFVKLHSLPAHYPGITMKVFRLPRALPSSCQTSRLAAARFRARRSASFTVEIRGLEPLTYGLQSRRSSQLSYIPSLADDNFRFRPI